MGVAAQIAGTMKLFRMARVPLLLVALCGFVRAGSPGEITAVKQSSCDPFVRATADRLTFYQKTCDYASRTFNVAAAGRAGLFAGVAELRHGSEGHGPAGRVFGRRFGADLAGGAARNTGEYLVGALNREDPRFRPSNGNSLTLRAKTAFWSVFMARTDDGSVRPAFSKLAGAFSSGFMGTYALPPMHGSGVPEAMRRSGLVYGAYLSKAMCAEFRPELMNLKSRILKRNR